MKQSTSLCIFSLCILLLTLLSGVFGQSLPEEMDAYLKAQAEANGFMGSVLVARGDEVLFEQGYGMANLELNVPNTPQTVHRIGSVTKQFTAALILKLQEEGKVNVGDTLAVYLPDFPHAAEVTLQQLLNHTSGVHDNLETSGQFRQHLSLDELIATFKDYPLDFEPGTQWRYSNSGYALLTKVIEVTSDMSYMDYLEQTLLGPLGLTGLRVESQLDLIPNRAAGYTVAPGGYANARFIDPSIPSGAGFLISTVGELYRWDRALMTGRILSDTSREAMFARSVSRNAEQASPPDYYGDGWVIGERFGRPVIEHSGGIFGFTAMNAFYPEDELVVVVLANVENAPSVQIATDLAAMALGQLYSMPIKRVAIALDASVLEALVGTYQVSPELSLVIRTEAGHLYAQPPGGEEMELLAESETNFYVFNANVRLTFTTDADGTIDGFILHDNGQDMTARRLSDEAQP